MMTVDIYMFLAISAILTKEWKAKKVQHAHLIAVSSPDDDLIYSHMGSNRVFTWERERQSLGQMIWTMRVLRPDNFRVAMHVWKGAKEMAS